MSTLPATDTSTDLLHSLLEGTAAHTGSDFFAALVRHLAEALGTAGAWVTEPSADLTRLRAHSFWCGGRYVPDFEYAVAGTPCGVVLAQGTLFHVPENLIEMFPDDADLPPLGAVGYLGMPLRNAQGAIIGHLGAFDTKPLILNETVERLFRIFGARAAAEIERLRAEQRIRDRERQVSGLLDGAWEPILEIDCMGRICHANLVCARKFGKACEDLLGLEFAGLLEPKSAARWRDQFSAAVKGFSSSKPLWLSDLQLRAADGTLFPAEASLCGFERDGQRYWTAILRDLHEQREAERRMAALIEESSILRDQLSDALGDARPLGEMIGESRPMLELFGQLRQVAPTGATVLIQGESGTGKELIARAIHDASARRSRPMVKVNCGAIPAALMESEFFGHEKGAFTGATERREGRFARADGGTLFLDEVGELPLDLQVKLLRVLQDGEFEPVGGSRTRSVNVRVLAATNRSLEKEVEQGRFRADLFYRLNVFPIAVPALRDRGRDVELLAEALLNRLSVKLNRRFRPLSRELRGRLCGYPWPGNVRELENLLERAAILSRGEELLIDERLLPSSCEVANPLTATSLDQGPDAVLTIAEMQALERANLVRALERCAWRVSGEEGAAKLLGIAPSTLASRMKALAISRDKAASASR